MNSCLTTYVDVRANGVPIPTFNVLLGSCMFVCLFSWHVTVFVYTLSLAQFLLERSCAANLPTYYAYFLELLIINNIMIIMFIIIVLIIIFIRTWHGVVHLIFLLLLQCTLYNSLPLTSGFAFKWKIQ